MAVRIKRSGWEKALSLGVLTSFEPAAFRNRADLDAQFSRALVHVQWDPELSLRGAALNYYSIQVGLSRHVIRQYVEEWIVAIDEFTPQVRKIADFLRAEEIDKAKRQLPPERVYPVDPGIGGRLLIGG